MAAAGTELAEAERALAQLPGGPGTVAEMNAALSGLQRRITMAATAGERAKVELTVVPAKVLATQLDPGAKRHGLVRSLGAYRWCCGCSPALELLAEEPSPRRRAFPVTGARSARAATAP